MKSREVKRVEGRDWGPYIFISNQAGISAVLFSTGVETERKMLRCT
jgi:hypothetical protein